MIITILFLVLIILFLVSYREEEEYFTTTNTINTTNKNETKIKYSREKDRDITSKPMKNKKSLVTEYEKDYVQTLNNYSDYINYQTYLRDTHEVKGSNGEINPKVVKDLRWNIHRWSLWDYMGNIDYPYYCRSLQYNGNQKCIPLTKKRYCTIDRLYKDPSKCLKDIEKYKKSDKEEDHES